MSRYDCILFSLALIKGLQRFRSAGNRIDTDSLYNVLIRDSVLYYAVWVSTGPPISPMLISYLWQNMLCLRREPSSLAVLNRKAFPTLLMMIWLNIYVLFTGQLIWTCNRIRTCLSFHDGQQAYVERSTGLLRWSIRGICHSFSYQSTIPR